MTVDLESDLRIDAARLWASLMDLASIGATPLGGVRRITLTDLDRQGRDRVVEWFRAAPSPRPCSMFQTTVSFMRARSVWSNSP